MDRGEEFRMDRRIARFIGCLALAVCIVATPSRAADEIVDEIDVLEPIVVARVGESPIMRATLDAAVESAGYERLASEEVKRRARAEVLEQLIDEQLLALAIEREGKVATDGEIDAFISRLDTRLAAGRDEKTLRRKVALEIGVNKMIVSRITKEAIEAAYTQHRAELDGSLVRVSHVLLRPDIAVGPDAVEKAIEKASSIRSEILQGSLSFADAARRHSAGPSRRQGGDIGFVPRAGVMVEEFASRVFSLKKGEISRPFVTPFGVHLATVTAIRPGAVSDTQIRPQVERLAGRKLLREILERERKETKIFYGPGVPHFERDADDPSSPPKLVVEPRADGF